MVHLLPNGVDDGGVVVALFLGGKPKTLIENQRVLLGATLLLSGLGNWGDEFGSPARVGYLLGGLARNIKCPVTVRDLIRGVENWLFKEEVAHLLFVLVFA